MIPPYIHQIWIGDKPEPTKWTDSFRVLKRAGWEYHLWGEKEIENLNLTNAEQYAWLRSRNIYFGCSDVARYEILLRYGGWYFDADSELLAPLAFTLAPFHRESDFVVARPVAELPGRIGRLPSTTIGASVNNPIMAQAVQLVGELSGHELLPPWDAIGGTLMTRAIDNLGMRDRITILDAKAFYPFNIDGTVAPDSPQETYSVHRWGSTYSRYAEGVNNGELGLWRG
jgi:hypothetical protein